MGERFTSILAAVLAGAAMCVATAQQRWIASLSDRGLPAPGARWLPWSDDERHPANRVFQLTFFVDFVPAEVGFALPAESTRAAEHGPDGRYFGKRAGGPADRRLFGGDGLQLPRESFSESEAKALRDALDALSGDAILSLRAETAACAFLQCDLLRMARRLLDTGSNPELLAPLLQAARRLALPRATLSDHELSTFSIAQAATIEPEIEPSRLVEIERRSTRLFDAEHSLLWSRVFLEWPTTATRQLREELAAVAAGEKPSVPVGARAILIQGIVALDDQGKPCATDLAIDVRLQRFVGALDALAAAASTTRDGVDFRVFWLERETLRRLAGKTTIADFRELHDDDQVLFRDYGTPKHTTLSAQCTLCHRTSGTPEPELAGFPLLRKHAQPRIASSPRARMELAERQFATFFAELEAAAK